MKRLMIPINYSPAVQEPNEFTLAQGSLNTTGPATVMGYISRTGKLVLPNKSVDQLKLDFNLVGARMKVGVDVAQQKIDTLYLVPTRNAKADAYDVIHAAKGYTIDLGHTLLKEGIMYKTVKYTFTIEPFLLAEGIDGYQLRLHEPIPKLFYIWRAFKGLQRQL